ncbi:MAG: NmrA family transcriptional regulator [Pseudonocardiaceae bacterium]
MTYSLETKPVLVLGATGTTGSRVAQRLTATGVPVRLGSRSGSPAFEWENPASWSPMLKGARAAYLVYYPDLAFPGAAEKVGAFIDTALRHGVRRLVLLSGRGEPQAQLTEQMLINSGADWTVVRSSFFAQNFGEKFFLYSVRSGVLALPVPDVPEPFVDVDDIADIVAAALTEDVHIGQLYEVTGPELLTFTKALELISQEIGRALTYVGLPPEDFAAALRTQGLPDDLVEGFTQLLPEVLDGRNASVTDGVHRALGRPPRSFADYVRGTADAGVWAD